MLSFLSDYCETPSSLLPLQKQDRKIEVGMSIGKYDKAIKLTRIVEVCALICAVLGGIIALIGFSTGGMLGMLVSSLDRSSGVGFLARILAMFPGLAIVVVSLYFYVQCAAVRAAVDTADLTHKMWAHMSGATESNSTTGLKSSLNQTTSMAGARQSFADFKDKEELDKNDSNQPTSENMGFDEDGVRLYKGKTIQEIEGKYHVDGEVFWTLGKAKKHVDMSA